MRYSRVLLVLVALVPLQIYGQTPDWPVFRWEGGKPNSQFAVYEGYDVKALTYNGTSVTVIMNESGDYLAFLVHVANNGRLPILVNPASASTRIELPKPNLLLSIPVDKVAKAMEKRGRWKSMLGAFFAGMATRQTYGTITDSYGNQSSVVLTEPDYAAQRNARIAAQERRLANQDAAAVIREIGLRANSINPGEYKVGWMFFEKKKFSALTFSVFTGEAMYEFPFSKAK